MRALRNVMSLMMITTLILAGCGGSGDKGKTASNSTAPKAADTATASKGVAAPAAPTTTVPVRIAPGPWGSLIFMPEMVAEGIGAFKQQGVDLKVLQTPGGNDATKALMTGEADFAMLAFDHVLKNRAQGADLVVVSFLNQNPGLVVVVQNDLKDKVKSVKDLKGKKVGVSSLGGGTHSAMLSLMKQAGMAPEDIEFIAAKDKLGEMWDKKEIAAACHVDPQITELTNAGKAWILYDFRTSKDTKALYGTGYPLGTLVTRQEIIDKNPAMVQKVVNAVMSANQFIASNKPGDISGKVAADYKGSADAKLYEAMVSSNIEALSLTGTVPQDSMETVLRELIEKKVIPADSKVTIETSTNLTFVRNAPK